VQASAHATILEHDIKWWLLDASKAVWEISCSNGPTR